MTTPEVDLGADTPRTRRSGAVRRLLRKPMGLGSIIILLALVVVGLLEPVLSTHPPQYASLDMINAPAGTPGWPLGGDQFGRDIWARALVSINVSLISALIGTTVALLVGITFGLIAGFAGGRVDGFLSWLFNLLMTFPALVLVIVLSAVVGNSYQVMMAIFGFFLAPGIFRLVRNLVTTVRHELYVDAARVAGLSTGRILSRHILYVVRGPIIVSTAFLASTAIGVQAGLAFMGIGSTQTPSFGSMTSDAFLNIYANPVQLVWPAGLLALLTGALVLLGNAYRDALAAPVPRAKRRMKPTRRGALEAGGSRSAAGTTDGGLLRVRNLRVSYPQVDGSDREVVRGVSFDVNVGEVVGLVGESGSGKTQTAFSILGVLPAQSTVSADVLAIAGDSVLGDRAALRKLRGGVIAYIPQEPMSNLDPTFTVGSQLIEGLSGGMRKKEARAYVLELLARVGIADPERTFRSYPHEISGGMAQRVLIAGAIANRPRLLIADEPTTALDVTVQAEILDLLRDLQKEFGMGVLLVTHNFGVVADLCDRVLVMRQGELVESGEVNTIFKAPTHEYTRKLITSILDEDVVREDIVPSGVARQEQAVQR